MGGVFLLIDVTMDISHGKFISGKQARSKHKMTGGAERVAHINSPPPHPTSVPRLKHTSW